METEQEQEHQLANFLEPENMYFKEVAGIMIPCTSLEWSEWFSKPDRILKKSELNYCKISSVALGLNHACGEDKNPLLYETMIFGDLYPEAQWRFSTRQEMLNFHNLLLGSLSKTEALLSRRRSWRRVKPHVRGNALSYLDNIYWELGLKRLCNKIAAGRI